MSRKKNKCHSNKYYDKSHVITTAGFEAAYEKVKRRPLLLGLSTGLAVGFSAVTAGLIGSVFGHDLAKYSVGIGYDLPLRWAAAALCCLPVAVVFGKENLKALKKCHPLDKTFKNTRLGYYCGLAGAGVALVASYHYQSFWGIMGGGLTSYTALLSTLCFIRKPELSKLVVVRQKVRQKKKNRKPYQFFFDKKPYRPMLQKKMPSNNQLAKI